MKCLKRLREKNSSQRSWKKYLFFICTIAIGCASSEKETNVKSEITLSAASSEETYEADRIYFDTPKANAKFVIPDTSGNGFLKTFCFEKPKARVSLVEYGPNSECRFVIPEDSKVYSFGTFRRAIPRDECDELVAEWKKLLKNAKVACVLGRDVEVGGGRIIPAGRTKLNIDFDRLETDKGCVGRWEECPSLKESSYPTALNRRH